MKDVKQFIKSDGHQYVSLTKDGETNDLKVCNLVWESFKGKIPEGFVVAHIDGDKSNNNLENLKLVSIKELKEQNALETQKRIFLEAKRRKD